MDTWNAFCTIHWFITGEQIIASSEHPLTNDLYYWYSEIEDKNYAQSNPIS